QDLARALKLVKGVVPSGDRVIAVLRYVLLTAARDELRLSGTDLETSIRVGCEAHVDEPGSILIDAALLLHDAQSQPSEAALVLKLENDSWISLACGDARFRLAGLDSSDFPAIPAPGKEHVAIAAADLLALIERVGFAMTQEDARYYLAGARFELGSDYA